VSLATTIDEQVRAARRAEDAHSAESLRSETETETETVTLSGYSDRWQRNLRRTQEILEDGLHPAGVALVMCDRRFLSSDPSDWDEPIAESTSAERYSRRLSERITEGYAAKFDQESDPGGHAALGFRRSGEPPHTLEIDPATIGTAVGLFARYALGTVSERLLAVETGLAETRIRMILMNPLYNGWIRRHRGPNETRRPAPLRADPPVSDGLWAQVEQVRRGKTRGGGPKQTTQVDLLGGLLECVCGRHLRSDGRFSDGQHRKLHPDPCEAWGRRARLPDATWELPVLAQVAGLDIGNSTIAAVVAALGSADRPVTIDRGRIERQMRDSLSTTPGERSTTRPISIGWATFELPSPPWTVSSGWECQRSGPWRGCAPLPRPGKRRTCPRRRRSSFTRSTNGSSWPAGPLSRRGSRHPPTPTAWRWHCPNRLQWRARQDSNLRPSAPEADALSTELQARERESTKGRFARRIRRAVGDRSGAGDRRQLASGAPTAPAIVRSSHDS
jgi:hypothetical protein